ncbi:MAG: MBOAT family protein [Hyphomonadaceae bacterium]|nr:MBOAT family protein [Hyphomonadaceae bacterium]
MVFSSSIFLFLFLPLCIGVDRLLGTLRLRTPQNLFLLFASLVFYAYGEAYYVFLMLASILGNYLFGLAIGATRGRMQALMLGLGVAANILTLTYYKYFGFLVENANALAGLFGAEVSAAPVHLPIGISFFTFQAISYLVDLKRGHFPVQKNPFDLGLYISMFPQLIAGPIVRYELVQAEIQGRKATFEGMVSGLRLFCVGLFQKAVIADTMARIVDYSVLHNDVQDFSTPMAWLFTTCYTLQIFFDFAGYSIMALGLGRVFGFTFPLNFDQPYISRSIREFWRRWHISLSSWFRDYLYIPLGGSRGGEIATYRNLLIVFFTTGIWHGASWNFVFWGLFHGFFIVIERSKRIGGVLDAMPFLLQRIYLLLVVMIGWVFFRLEEFPDAIAVVQAMFTWKPLTETTSVLAHPLYYLDGWTLLVLGVAIIWSLISPERGRWIAALFGKEQSGSREAVLNIGALLLLAVALGLVVSGSYTAFIYFRF